MNKCDCARLPNADRRINNCNSYEELKYCQNIKNTGIYLNKNSGEITKFHRKHVLKKKRKFIYNKVFANNIK